MDNKSKSMFYEFYKDMYFHEIDRRKEHRDRADVPFSIFSTISIVIVSFFYKEIFKISNIWIYNIAIVFLVIYLFSILIFLWNYFYFLRSTRIKAFPKMVDFRKNELQYYQYLDENEMNYDEATEATKKNIIDNYIECHDFLRVANKTMLVDYHNLVKILKASIILGVALFFIIFMNTIIQ